MLPGHHTTTRCNAGLLLIVFEKYRCLTCRPIIQLSHHGNAVMVEWLRHLTRNQMGSSCVGLNPTRSSDRPEWGPAQTTYGTQQAQSKATDTRPQCQTWPDISRTASLSCRFVYQCLTKVDNTVKKSCATSKLRCSASWLCESAQSFTD